VRDATSSALDDGLDEASDLGLERRVVLRARRGTLEHASEGHTQVTGVSEGQRPDLWKRRRNGVAVRLARAGPLDRPGEGGRFPRGEANSWHLPNEAGIQPGANETSFWVFLDRVADVL